MDRAKSLVKRLDHLRERLNALQVSKPSIVHDVNLHRGICLNYAGLLRAGYYDDDRLDKVEQCAKKIEQFLIEIAKGAK